MRPRVLKKRAKERRKRLIEQAIPIDIYVPYTLEELPDELLYKLGTSKLCTPQEFNRVIELLTERMKPVIFRRTSGYFTVFCWSDCDAVAEGMEVIWKIIKDQSYSDRGPFRAFFAVCYKNRLGQIYRKGVRHNPDISHNIIIGYQAKLPVFNEAGYFNLEYIEKENRSRRKNSDV